MSAATTSPTVASLRAWVEPTLLSVIRGASFHSIEIARAERTRPGRARARPDPVAAARAGS